MSFGTPQTPPYRSSKYSINPMMQNLPSSMNSGNKQTNNYAHFNNCDRNQMLPSPPSNPEFIKAREKERVKNRVNIAQLDVTASVSSEKIVLQWEAPRARKELRFIVNSAHLDDNNVLTVIEKPAPYTTIELRTIPGKNYEIDIRCQSFDDGYLIADWSKKIRSEFNANELKHLFDKCQHFIKISSTNPQMHEFWVVYRCKPKAYWDEIFYYCNDIMQKYTKDENGQPGNLINGRIKGLFFSANLLSDGNLPTLSWFGDVRMTIDAYIILNPNRHRFYFADFYCNTNTHYVTVVICVADSDTDKYCREKLIELDPLSNPFVKLVPPADFGGKWRFYLNKLLLVELYYTEDLKLDVGHFSHITPRGAGSSRANGVPNNKKCNICNLYANGRRNRVD